MKAILDKGNGLMKGRLLSHMAFFECPYYHKFLCITDAALNITPDFNEKVGIIKNAVECLSQAWEFQCPKLAFWPLLKQ